MAAELARDRRFLEKCILGILLLGIVSTQPPTDKECIARSKCHDHSILTPGPLSSNAIPRDGDYMRPEQSYAMNFCVEGYTSLTWSKKDFAIDEPHRPFPSGSRGALCRQNQTLAFASLETGDSGFYRVVASNGTHELEHVFFLSVDKDAKPVGRVTPYQKPEPRVEARIGDIVTLNCSGHFGSGERALQNLEWMLYNDSLLVDLPSDSHYYVENTPSNCPLRASRLHVLGVRQEDFHKTFLCRMDTAIRGNKYSFNVTFVHPETENRTFIIIVICVVSTVIFVGFAVAAWLCWRKNQFFRYKCARHWRRLKARGNPKHDIFLFSHEDNMEWVQSSLQPRLEAMGFKVCEYHRDAPGNRQEVEVQEERMRQSACTLLVHSSSDLDSHNTDTLVSMATKKGHLVVVVLLESRRDIQDSLGQCPPDQQQNIRKVPQFFDCLEWPGNEDNGQVQNFWDKLQRCLPRPAASADPRRHARPSSSQPLISSSSPAEERAARYLPTPYSDEEDYPPVFADPVEEEEEEESSVCVDMPEDTAAVVAAGRSQVVAVPGRRDSKPLKQQVSKDSGFASPHSCDTAPIADHSPPRWPQPV